MAQGHIRKAGAFYSYGETRLGQGREASKQFLADHPEIAESVEGRIRGKMPEAEEPSSNGARRPEESAELLMAAGDSSEGAPD